MKTALVTGASSGIGEAFARELARKKIDLVLVARSQNKLQQLATELADKYAIATEVIALDLTLPAAGKSLFDKIAVKDLTIDLLINNAGFGDYGAFSDRPLEKQLTMIQLNNTVVVELTGLFLSAMKQRGKGAIVNISSIAAFQPVPYMSVYAATKAFILNFTEAIWAENKDSGVRILAVCPGPTESQFYDRAAFPDSMGEMNGGTMNSPEAVVAETFKALEQQQSTIVTGGIGNQLIVNLPRFFPRDLLVSVVSNQFKQGATRES
ncbi:SDR family NAD(P)-dependent oxidoreductase [Myxosarcina sp. GI1(2024)]